LERREHVLLEIGPRNTLATLARQQPLLQKQRVAAIASLSDAPGREHAALVAAFGQAWVAGVPLRPETLDRRERKARLRLPTYPFERKRFWIDVAAEQSPIAAAAVTGDAAQAAAPDASAHGPASAPQAGDDIGRRLRAPLKDVAGFDVDSADPQANFFELGLDSLVLTQVAQRIEAVLRATITFRQLMESCNTLGAVEAALQDAVATVAPAAAARVVNAAPAPHAVVPHTPAVAGGAMASILDAQLQLMSQQLAALSAGGEDQASLLDVLQQQQLLMSQQLTIAVLAEPDGPEPDPPQPPQPPGGTRKASRSGPARTDAGAAAAGVATPPQVAECASAAPAADATDDD